MKSLCFSYYSRDLLLNNDKNTGALEFAYQGPLLKLVKGKTKIAITFTIIKFLRLS